MTREGVVAPTKPPTKAPMAQPRPNTAISVDDTKSEKPSSCSHSVKNTIAFQGVVPTIPYRHACMHCAVNTGCI